MSLSDRSDLFPCKTARDGTRTFELSTTTFRRKFRGTKPAENTKLENKQYGQMTKEIDKTEYKTFRDMTNK